MQTIVRVKFGSHLYGTNTPSSDVDYKSVHIPSSDEILLQKVSNSITVQRSKAEGERNNADDVDEESYSIGRYLDLLAQGQTVAIDMLFAPPEMCEVRHVLWDHIVDCKDKLLSKKAQAFLGYCRAQANKYSAKGSRVEAARTISNFFEQLINRRKGNSLVGDFEGDLKDIISDSRANYDQWPKHVNIVQQPVNRAGDIGTFLEVCNRKIDFEARVQLAWEISQRIYDRYGDRAKKAQTNDGIDWKALSHAVRVGTEALELMSTGKVTFPLPNADHILAIKQGKVPYEEVVETIDALLPQVEEATENSILPSEPDYKWISNLVRSVHLTEVLGNHSHITY